MQLFQLSVLENSPAVLTAYLHEVSPEMNGRSPRPAMLVLPGGGYHFCSDREAEPIALVFAAMGFNAFVVWYRIAPHRHPSALQDVAEAVAYLLEADAVTGAVIPVDSGQHLLMV